MATISYRDDAEVNDTLTSFLKKEVSLSTLNSKASVIPPYSKINSVTASVDAKQNLGGSKTDIHFYFIKGNTNVGTISLITDVVGTSYSNHSCDLTAQCASGNANAGKISFTKNGNVADGFRVYNQCDVIRTLYLKNFAITWNYTPPTYVISLTAGTGGTVSGAGTYEVGSTATIKATPNSGYKFVKWSDGNTNAERQITITSSDISANVTNLSYTATFEKTNCTVNFKNQDGSVVKTSSIQQGAKLGTLPTVSRSGYTFVGWIPCAHAKKTDGTVLDSCQYDGNTAYALDKKYKYTDKLSVHIEAYMSDWADIKNLKSQIASCTEGGGWGLGFQANTTGNGSEIYSGGSYRGIDLGFNTPSNFTNETWYSFDIVFSNGTFEVYLNGTKKGTQTTAASTISYNSDNTIFVGAEAGKTATTPAGNYFKGYISNVFIANQGTRLQVATTNTVVESNVDYYPIWRKNTAQTRILIDSALLKGLLIDTDKVKAVYIDTTKVYG